MDEKRHRIRPKIHKNSLELRRDATYPERVLWQSLRSRQVAGLKFRRQHPIDQYIVDFYCAEASLVIELDGRSHDDRHVQDRERQSRLESLGYRVLRISNDDVLDNLDGVLEAIARVATEGGC